MNGQVVVGVLLNAALCAATWTQMPTLAMILALCAGCSAAGILLYVAGTRKPGAYLIIAGAIPFVPLGMIAVLGARKLLDAMTVAEFEARRARL